MILVNNLVKKIEFLSKISDFFLKPKTLQSFRVSFKTISVNLVWIYMLEFLKKTENNKINKLKLFPENTYELAQHPSIL